MIKFALYFNVSECFMNLRTQISRILAISTAAIGVGIPYSCTHSNSIPTQPESISEISDTLRAGNLAKASEMTEELKKAAVSAGDSLLWSEAMVQQGVNAYYQGDADRLYASSDSAMAWLTRQKDTPERARVLAKAYQTHGAYYDQYNFNPDSSAYYLRKAVDNVEKSGIRSDLPQAYGNYANALRMAASLDSAAVYYHRAISIADSLKLEPIHYIPLYNGIASVFTDMRDFRNSSIWWKKSIDILGEMNQFDKFNTLTGYGNDLYYQEDYEGSNRIFTQLREMLDSVPDAKWETMFTDVNLADTYIRSGQIAEGEKLLKEPSEYFSTEQPNPVVSSYIHTIQIRAALYNGKYEEGVRLAMEHPEADTLRLEQHLARLKVLEDLYSNIGNTRLAYLTRTRYDHLNDSLRSYKLSQQISALNAQYKRDNRILNLESANSFQKARIYRLFALVALSVAVIVGLILLFMVRRANERKREERMMSKIINLRKENLRNRVTPHFIYNALNHELLNSKNGKTSHLDALISLIRHQQVIASKVLIPFSEELKFADDYIRVLGDNGRDPFIYNCDIQPGIDKEFLFPAMSLQILLENAIKHGFSSLLPGEERVLDISVRKTDEKNISVAVFNNKGPHASEASGTGTGLRVLMETIRLINEHEKEQIYFKLNLNSEHNGLKGCTAVITVPCNLNPHPSRKP